MPCKNFLWSFGDYLKVHEIKQPILNLRILNLVAIALTSTSVWLTNSALACPLPVGLLFPIPFRSYTEFRLQLFMQFCFFWDPCSLCGCVDSWMNKILGKVPVCLPLCQMRPSFFSLQYFHDFLDGMHCQMYEIRSRNLNLFVCGFNSWLNSNFFHKKPM